MRNAPVPAMAIPGPLTPFVAMALPLDSFHRHWHAKKTDRQPHNGLEIRLENGRHLSTLSGLGHWLLGLLFWPLFFFSALFCDRGLDCFDLPRVVEIDSS